MKSVVERLGFYESRALHWKVLKARKLFPNQKDFSRK
jgi:hypothetical protein